MSWVCVWWREGGGEKGEFSFLRFAFLSFFYQLSLSLPLFLRSVSFPLSPPIQYHQKKKYLAPLLDLPALVDQQLRHLGEIPSHGLLARRPAEPVDGVDGGALLEEPLRHFVAPFRSR